jgi:hypothetical protein
VPEAEVDHALEGGFDALKMYRLLLKKYLLELAVPILDAVIHSRSNLSILMKRGSREI